MDIRTEFQKMGILLSWKIESIYLKAAYSLILCHRFVFLSPLDSPCECLEVCTFEMINYNWGEFEHVILITEKKTIQNDKLYGYNSFARWNGLTFDIAFNLIQREKKSEEF